MNYIIRQIYIWKLPGGKIRYRAYFTRETFEFLDKYKAKSL